MERNEQWKTVDETIVYFLAQWPTVNPPHLKESAIVLDSILYCDCFWNPLISMQKIGPKENK